MLRIPIRSHLFKYLKSQIGSGQFQIKRVSAHEVDDHAKMWCKRLSDLIFPLLQKDFNYKLEDLPSTFKQYAFITFMPTDDMLKQKRVCISKKGVVKINAVLNSYFMDDLVRTLDPVVAKHERIDMKILEFMNEHEIDEDDIRFDSLKKNYYRERVRASVKILPANSTTAQGVLDMSFSEKLIQR